MNGSSTDDQSTTTETTSTVAAPVTMTPPFGSGSSVVLDQEPGLEAESRSKLPSSRFKGVVPQPNGRWGAQIYEKHQRVWLGTFNEEHEAAKAYDTAVIRFRGRDAVTNLKPVVDTEEASFETSFLNSHSKAEIVDMLRKHTYIDELEQSKRNRSLLKTRFTHGPYGPGNKWVNAREDLFEKVVTPSDVGKLNRLVIPKQQAEKHFPLQTGNISKGVLLHFEDVGMKVWRFRYSYWNSSQSYVLTKGWSRFVKEKSLKAGDIVSFQRSTGPDKQLYIGWKAKNGPGNVNPIQPVQPVRPVRPVQPVQMFRLFGVDIFKGDNNDNMCNGKRNNIEMLLGIGDSKKQRIIHTM